MRSPIGPFARDERGQAATLVGLMMVVLLGFTALAVDGGRFYMERRFLQNAADAAALACVQRLVSGGNTTEAVQAARDLLVDFNLRGSPNGTTIVVASTPEYNGWYNGIEDGSDKRNLSDGIVATATDCRVALRASVQMFFIQVVSADLATLEVPAYAHAGTKGGMLPIVVNRFDEPPGPGGSFHDYARQEAFDSNCDDNDANGDEGACPWATAADPGRERVIVGQGYSASDADFRGFIALDVRDFADPDVRIYYNGAAGLNVNALKDKEASYLAAGYPGPDLPAYDPMASPVQSGLQIAVMSGNSTGIVVDELKQHYQVGDKIMVQFFDGQVREVPDFTLNPPSSIAVSSPQASQDGGTFRVGANQRFRADGSLVTLRMERDVFDGTGSDTPAELHGPPTQDEQFRFSPGSTSPILSACPATGCFTPQGGAGTTVTIEEVEMDSGVAPGIYSVVIKGIGYTATGTLLSTKRAFVMLNVGGVTQRFDMSFGDGTTAEVDANGTATFTMQLVDPGSGSNTWGTNPVTLSLDHNSCLIGQVELRNAAGTAFCFGGATISTNLDYVPKRHNQSPPTVTIAIPTSGLANGAYTLVLRGRGINGSGQPVVRVQELTVTVGATGGTTKKYVNVQGYAVFQIVSCTIANSNNAVCGKAITGAVHDPDDPSLAVGKRVRLLPWSSPPY